ALAGCGSGAEPRESVAPPPTAPTELHGWLVAGDYASWDRESRVLPALNGAGRRVFLSPDIDQPHSPVGAAAVREMYEGTSGGAPWSPIGWSVLVKVDDRG